MQGHLNVLEALWITGDRPRESATPIPVRAMAGGGRAGQVRRAGLATRLGLPFCSQAWPWGSSMNGQEGPREEKRRK